MAHYDRNIERMEAILQMNLPALQAYCLQLMIAVSKMDYTITRKNKWIYILEHRLGITNQQRFRVNYDSFREDVE